MQSLKENRGPICSMCNIVQIKLVPLYDNDQEHKNIQCCQKCKKLLRTGKQREKNRQKQLNAGKLK